MPPYKVSFARTYDAFYSGYRNLNSSERLLAPGICNSELQVPEDASERTGSMDLELSMFPESPKVTTKIQPHPVSNIFLDPPYVKW